MFRESRWDERIIYRENASRQKIERFHKQREAIDNVLEDMYTSFCIRLRSGVYDQERAFKTAVFEQAETYVYDNPWLYEDDPQDET